MNETINAVLRSSNGHQDSVFVMTETSILDIENLQANGYEYLFAVEKGIAPKTCSCGAEIKRIVDVEDEPASITYECGKLILRDYPNAVYKKCGKWEKDCALL